MNFLLLLLLCVSPSGWAIKPSQKTSTSNNEVAVKAVTAIQQLFGPGVEVAKELKPYFLTGDFNGDSFRDLLVVVRVIEEKPSPANVHVMNPWGASTESALVQGTLALVIIHGTNSGGVTVTEGRVYLLSDREFFATPIWEDPAQENLLGVRRKVRGRRNSIPATAKGDAISVATEAGIDLLLYWNGKGYKLFTPAEEP